MLSPIPCYISFCFWHPGCLCTSPELLKSYTSPRAHVSQPIFVKSIVTILTHILLMCKPRLSNCRNSDEPNREVISLAISFRFNPTQRLTVVIYTSFFSQFLLHCHHFSHVVVSASSCILSSSCDSPDKENS